MSDWEAWLPTVTGGVENVERATQWVNMFRYHRQTQIVSNASATLHLSEGQAAPVALDTGDGDAALEGRQLVRGGCKPDSIKASCHTDKNTCKNKVVQNCSILPHTAWTTRKGMTQETCAEACARANFVSS